jgi:Fe-S-cluster-containing hydrogenase component 2
MEGQNIKYNAKKCIGCHLCRLVCPINAIGTAGRIDKKLLVKK